MKEPTSSQNQNSESSHAAQDEVDSFEREAEGESLSLFAEFLLFLKENKAWWLIPILLSLLLLGLAVFLSGSAFAPFIYPLF